jgi:hypothetical protein
MLGAVSRRLHTRPSRAIRPEAAKATEEAAVLRSFGELKVRPNSPQFRRTLMQHLPCTKDLRNLSGTLHQNLGTFDFAPADLPIVRKLVESA